MKKKTGFILIGVCALVLTLCVIPAFAAPIAQSVHNGWCPEREACQQHFIGRYNDNTYDYSASWYCQQCQRYQQNYLDENENGVCDHYESGECEELCDGTGPCYGRGCDNDYGYGNESHNSDTPQNNRGCGNGYGCGNGKHCNW